MYKDYKYICDNSAEIPPRKETTSEEVKDDRVISLMFGFVMFIFMLGVASFILLIIFGAFTTKSDSKDIPKDTIEMNVKNETAENIQESPYTEAVVKFEETKINIDVEKSKIEFFAKIDENSTSGYFIKIQKNKLGDYILYNADTGEEIVVSPDKVEYVDGIENLSVVNRTTSYIQEYENGEHRIRWKTEEILYIPIGSMIVE